MHGEYKVPAGKLVAVDLEVVDQKISQAVISGDFFLEPDQVLDRLTGALVGVSVHASIGEVVRVLEQALEPGDVLFGVDLTGIATALRRALGHAMTWEDLNLEIIYTPALAPVENMALDEILPAQVGAATRRPFLRFWEWNKPLLVMGSFQSYTNEVNPAGLAKHNIVVSRRITGGGTLFMEPANCITYSLVVPTSLVEGLSFAQSYPFLDQWVMEALEKVGVRAQYVPLNDIASEVGKIGGAAQKRFSTGVILHHVTLAYDIDTDKMLECMRIGQEKLRDKGTTSANKRVDPMRSQTGMKREDIIQIFAQHFANKYGATVGELTPADIAQAQALAQTKFLDPKWIHRIA